MRRYLVHLKLGGVLSLYHIFWDRFIGVKLIPLFRSVSFVVLVVCVIEFVHVLKYIDFFALFFKFQMNFSFQLILFWIQQIVWVEHRLKLMLGNIAYLTIRRCCVPQKTSLIRRQNIVLTGVRTYLQIWTSLIRILCLNNLFRSQFVVQTLELAVIINTS